MIERVPVVAVDAAAVRYGRRTVLQDLSLQVHAGETVALVGLNGAGKTTLLKAMLDLHPLAGGCITLFDKPHRLPAARSELAFLPERFAPNPLLTGREWLSFALAARGLAWSYAEARATCLGLALDPAALDRRIGGYSKGMTQKLGLVALFLGRRRCFILDEPFSGLDPLARLRLREHLQAYRAAGNTIFFSTHDLTDVDRLCDRLLILYQGRITFAGTPAALRAASGRDSIDHAFLDAVAGGQPEGGLDRKPSLWARTLGRAA